MAHVSAQKIHKKDKIVSIIKENKRIIVESILYSIST